MTARIQEDVCQRVPDVNMIVLDRVVNQSKAPAVAGRREALLQLADQSARSQRRHATPHLQRDVEGMKSRERRASPVRISRIRAALAARTRTFSTPAWCLSQAELELPTPLRHRKQCDSTV